MNYDTLKFVLETRIKAAKMHGNSAEQALMIALLALIEENELLKSKIPQGDE